MTAQAPDQIKIGNETYSIVGARGSGLFDPGAFGLRTQAITTACWRGYICEYSLLDGALFLTHLTLSVAGTATKRADTLILVDDRIEREVRRMEVEAGASVVIGSDAGCDLQIDDPRVPPRACRIAPAKRLWTVEKLAPDASILLGSEPGDEWRPLQRSSEFRWGTVLQLGDHSVHFYSGPGVSGPRLFGVDARFRGGRSEYRDFAAPIAFSGGILAADDFIQELYVHMGFHPAWKYRRVRELIFDAGKLAGDFDRTLQMAQLRAKLANAPREPAAGSSRSEIEAWVRQCFSLDYGGHDA